MFQVYSTSGKLMIDASMVGFFCRRSGTGSTVAASTSIGNTVRSQININASGTTAPIVAIRMPGYGAAFSYSFNGQMQFATDAPIGTPYTWYLFDWSAAIPTADHGAGLEIRNGSGQVVFSSAHRPFIALARDSYTRTDSSKVLAGASTTFAGYSFPTGFICYSDPSEATPVGPQLWDGQSCFNLQARLDAKLFGAAVSANGASVAVREISWDDVEFSIGSVGNSETIESINERYGWSVPGSIFAVDVTGIPVGQTFF